MNKLLRIPFDQASSASAYGQASLPRRILVVDDESYIRQFSAEVLMHSGYHVDTAEDGVLAWDALQLNSYDLLVTDNSMCRLTGIGLVRKLRAAGMALPVIMVSGAMPTDELKRHPWLQIDATLLKPFTTVDLLRTVRQVLHAADSVREQLPPPIPAVQSVGTLLEAVAC